MAEITAKLVNELRSKTGQGMMECKRALAETGGDVEKAIDYFRKKGIKTSITERAASEGRVVGAAGPDGRSAALVEVNCNTDFTAKSEPVHAAAMAAAKLLLSNPQVDLSQEPTVQQALTATAQQTGENVRLGRTAVLSNASGKVGLYLYTVTNKIGVIVSVTGNPSDDLLRDLGVHITAKKPVALAITREGLPKELVEKERQIAVAQAMETGKPQQIAEKIAEGKLRTFYEERVLLDQEFINPDKFKGSVAALLKANNCVLENYVRLEVGQ
ncbi:MAG TPA: translation elongation factor Ts [Tepidisphaeraceae bacterium]|nr:translation elongation factor Ts [Tepidisphaeraceae bacterium]